MQVSRYWVSRLAVAFHYLPAQVSQELEGQLELKESYILH